MRIARYFIIEKETKKVVFADCRLAKCEEEMKKFTDKDNFEIRRKMLSI